MKQKTNSTPPSALRKLRPTLLALLTILSTGCATRVVGCSAVPLKAYSQDFNLKLAGELVAATGTPAVWPQVVIDYAGLRDAVSACKGE